MSFTDKNISKLNKGILKDKGSGLYVRASEIAPGKVIRAFYLHWRVDGKQKHQKIGILIHTIMTRTKYEKNSKKVKAI